MRPGYHPGMQSPLHLVVTVIGWTPRADDPPELAPQFVNPVPVRVYTVDGIRRASAWLRLEGDRVIAATVLPESMLRERMRGAPRCFCCTLREHDPRSGIERRRITSIDLCLP